MEITPHVNCGFSFLISLYLSRFPRFISRMLMLSKTDGSGLSGNRSHSPNGSESLGTDLIITEERSIRQ